MLPLVLPSFAEHRDHEKLPKCFFANMHLKAATVGAFREVFAKVLFKDAYHLVGKSAFDQVIYLQVTLIA